MCRDGGYASQDDVEIDTWCGSAKDLQGEPVEECTLDGTNVPHHYVEVKNYKTWDRSIRAIGIVKAKNYKALFKSPNNIVADDQHWKEERIVGHSPHNDTWTFRTAQIDKESNASAGDVEDITTDIEYEDDWNAGNWHKLADTCGSYTFRVDII